MPRTTERVSTDGPAVHLEGHDVVITNSTFPISPIWDAMTALYGDPYKPVMGIDSLRAAKAIANPQDPVWAEVFEAFGDSHAVLPPAELEPPKVPSPWVDGQSLREVAPRPEDVAGLPEFADRPYDRLAAPPMPAMPSGRAITLAEFAEEMGVDLDEPADEPVPAVITLEHPATTEMGTSDGAAEVADSDVGGLGDSDTEAGGAGGLDGLDSPTAVLPAGDGDDAARGRNGTGDRGADPADPARVDG